MPKNLAPDVVLKRLKDGNHRFESGTAQHPTLDTFSRKELSAGQNPEAIVLSCSDSRVPPELIFDMGVGNLFVVRVAGNVLGAATVASIEYAVEHIGSRLLVVLGHDSCGTVKAALSTPANKTAGSPDLDTLVASIRPHVAGYDRLQMIKDKTLHSAVTMNIDGQAKRLLERSPIVKKAVTSGQLKVVKGVYSLSSGKVEFWEMSPEQMENKTRSPASAKKTKVQKNEPAIAKKSETTARHTH